jgi:GNAT superfamily N-acetyltransferase
VGAFHRHWAPSRALGHRYVAFVDGEAIGQAYLSLAGPAGVASIYGWSVRPEARGRGVAGGMTTTIRQRAKALGCTRVVLPRRTWRSRFTSRTGSGHRCHLTVDATAALWSDEH